jgi:hypothetical protein
MPAYKNAASFGSISRADKLEAEIAVLNNASMASKERLELDKNMAKADEHYVLESSPLLRTKQKEDKNKPTRSGS